MRLYLTAAVALTMSSTIPAFAGAYEFEDPVRLDHRDQWGVRSELGATLLSTADLRGEGDSAIAALLEIGVSRGLSHAGHELSLRVRPVLRGDSAGIILLSGYRIYAGMEHWKTFADVDLFAPIVPGPAAGLRLGFGVMFDPSRSLGFSLSGGAFAAASRRVISGFDVALGAQLRFD